MDASWISDLLRQLRDIERGQVRYRQGVVTDDSPLSVALGGSDVAYTDVRALDGAVLGVGDVVSVLTFGNDLLVLGRIGDGAHDWHLIGDPGQPAFANSWTNYGGVYAAARFLKDPLGFVHVEGSLKSGTTTAATTVFTLPAGYRPSATVYGVGVNSSNAACTFSIDSSGVLRTAGGWDSSFVSLGHHVFRAAS